MPERPVVALVALAESIHTARWINIIRDSGMRIALVGVTPAPPVEELLPWTPVQSRSDLEALDEGVIGVFRPETDRRLAEDIDTAAGFERAPHPAFGTLPITTAHHVTTALRCLEPDLVHSMEVQLAGYLTLEARRRMGPAFPPWLLSNWGSDVMLFRKLEQHRPVLERIFREIDGYAVECARDLQIAAEFDYQGRSFDPIPASGGMDIDVLKMGPPASRRRTILVKGYHGWSGRGLHILSAIHLAAAHVQDYAIRVIFPSAEATDMIEAIRSETGLDIRSEPHLPKHSDALDRLSEARMVVGLGISDGISTTLLEAMSVGTFPILADTSCACEWIRNGTDGLIVNPHDTAALAEAIVRAAKDDGLVDAAAIRNRSVVETRWSARENRPKMLARYASMLEIAASRRGPWSASPPALALS